MADVVPPKTKKEKKKMIEGLGTHIVRLNLPLYGLAVRHVDFEQNEEEDKAKEKGEGEGEKSQLRDRPVVVKREAPLVVVVGGGGGPGATGIDNRIFLLQFKVKDAHFPLFSPIARLSIQLSPHCSLCHTRTVAFISWQLETWESAPS